MKFKIKKISSGWFDVSFYKGELNSIEITASSVWGVDSPRLFLSALCNLLEGKTEHEFINWDEEPGVYFVCLEKNHISVFYTEICEDELPKQIRSHGTLSIQELSKWIDFDDTMLENEIRLEEFSESVYKEFLKYFKSKVRNKYTGNWMLYPEAEVFRLKKILEKKKNNPFFIS